MTESVASNATVDGNPSSFYSVTYAVILILSHVIVTPSPYFTFAKFKKKIFACLFRLDAAIDDRCNERSAKVFKDVRMQLLWERSIKNATLLVDVLTHRLLNHVAKMENVKHFFK